MSEVKYSKIGEVELESGSIEEEGEEKFRDFYWLITLFAILLLLLFLFPLFYVLFQHVQVGNFSFGVPKEIKIKECNPFLEYGRLRVDDIRIAGKEVEEGGGSIWIPYDTSCPPSTLLNDFYKLRNPGNGSIAVALNGSRENEMDWLRNRTILLLGDSVDRFTNRDLCRLLKGNATVIDFNHPASPPRYQVNHVPILDPVTGQETKASYLKKILREDMEWRWSKVGSHEMKRTSPWVCDIDEYGFTIINIFTFGLEGSDEHFKDDEDHHGPASFQERVDFIALPILQNVSRLLNRPQIIQPDLVQVTSGFWDTRQWYLEDKSVPPDLRIVGISEEREIGWETRCKTLIRYLAKIFTTKTILWRVLSMPAPHNNAPKLRVAPLNELGRHVISELQQEEEFKDRLRINEWGRLITGTEERNHRPNDAIHQDATGSFLHGSVLFYELKEAVRRQSVGL